jgi:PE-PPE domain/Phage integrase family
VFESARGGGYLTLGLTLGQARYTFAKAVAAVGGIDGARLHDLRHTCASLAISSGANVKVVQRLLGHKIAVLRQLTVAARRVPLTGLRASIDGFQYGRCFYCHELLGDLDGLTGADDLTLAVENEFKADPGAFSAEHPLTIFGYSQGAAVESIAMTQLAADGIPSADLHFVSIGDISLPVDGVDSNLVPDLDSLLGPNLTNTLVTFFGLTGILGNVTPDDLYPATIYTLDGDGFADFQQDFAAGGLLGVVAGVFVHADYLGLTPTQIADATTSTDGDLTLVDISDNINGFDALIGAIDNGVASSGLFESLFESLQLFLTNMF